jgi:hypothetical protein
VGGLEDNTLADGLFHAGTWLAVVIGLWILWRRSTSWRWAISGRAFVGWMLVGWGLFNLVEGIINHEILGLHYVREGAGHQTAYDLGFLLFGALWCSGVGFSRASARGMPRHPLKPRAQCRSPLSAAAPAVLRQPALGAAGAVITSAACGDSFPAVEPLI